MRIEADEKHSTTPLVKRRDLKAGMNEKGEQQAWMETAKTKPEGREGDTVAHFIASISVFLFATFSLLVVIFNDPKSLSFFAFHAPLQGLALSLFTWGKLSSISSTEHLVTFRSGILTLQPTSQPASKVAGLFRHQVWILYAAFPLMILGSLSVIYNKNINGRPHFVSWHGTFGIIATIWTVAQILVGGGSVWSDGKYFGGGLKAKSIWKYHRLSGYILYSLMVVTAHLGGAWSTFAVKNSSYMYRLLCCTLAPATALIAIYNRTRLSKMKFF